MYFKVGEVIFTLSWKHVKLVELFTSFASCVSFTESDVIVRQAMILCKPDRSNKNTTGLLQSFGSVNTTVWMDRIEKKATWELHNFYELSWKNAKTY